MQLTPQGIIASGDLYMDFLDSDGNSTGFVLAGNCKQFAPKVETETKDVITSYSIHYTKLYDQGR